ncbi:MAG: amino acid ABC transporter permease [Anaerolinea sp. 4484_236]|nr:MAG: amino acid ABC transporter permease [Anaerolinea sp. 4484_236]
MSTFLQVILNGLLNGLLYALIATGLSLIWGVMNVINFAHGEYLMVAMYLSYWLGFLLKVDPVISILAGGIFVFIIGALTYQLIIKYTIGKPPLSALLATFALSMVLKNVCLNRFSPNFKLLSHTWLAGKTITLGSIIVPLPQLATGILSLVIVGIVYVIMHNTRLGWAIQATAMDKEGAELMGINTEGVYLLVFGIGGACVGMAGGILPSYLAVHPDAGTLFCLIAFIIVTMGGFGSILGTFLAAIFIGLVEALSGFYIAPVIKYVAVFGIYLVVVMFRPRGLFGW